MLKDVIVNQKVQLVRSVRLGQTASDPVPQLRHLQEALRVPACQDSKVVIQPVYVDLPIALYFKGGGNVVIDYRMYISDCCVSLDYFLYPFPLCDTH